MMTTALKPLAGPHVGDDVAELRARIAALARELLDGQRQIIAGQRAILAAIEQQRLAAVAPADQERLAKLLPAIVGAYGSVRFLASDLAEDDSPALTLVTGGLNGRQLGMLFARCAEIPIEGHMVQRAGSASGSTLWRVVEVVVGDFGDLGPLDSLARVEPGGSE